MEVPRFISQGFVWALLATVRVYQVALSPLFRPACRFWPSCSDYAAESIQQYGAMRGVWLALRRLARCHPWRAGGFDPP